MSKSAFLSFIDGVPPMQEMMDLENVIGDPQFGVDISGYKQAEKLEIEFSRSLWVHVHMGFCCFCGINKGECAVKKSFVNITGK